LLVVRQVEQAVARAAAIFNLIYGADEEDDEKR
jgi:hypothetical protein